MPGGRPPKYETDEQLSVMVDDFFDECDLNEEPYTITGLGLAIGLDRHQLISYGKKEEFYHTVKKAKQKCENFAEKRLFTGQPTGAIFALKNYGWKDQQQIDHGITEKLADHSERLAAARNRKAKE